MLIVPAKSPDTKFPTLGELGYGDVFRLERCGPLYVKVKPISLYETCQEQRDHCLFVSLGSGVEYHQHADSTALPVRGAFVEGYKNDT